MQKRNIEATEDNVIETIKNDRLRRSMDVRAMIEFLDKRNGNTFIAIDAEWGAGKSFFVRQIEMTMRFLTDKTWPHEGKYSTERLEIIDLQRKAIENNQVLREINIEHSWLPIYFNAWMYDDNEEPLLSLMLAILKETGHDIRIKKKENIVNKVIALAKGVKIINIFTSKYPVLNILDTEKLMDAFGGMNQNDILTDVKSAEEIKMLCKNIFDEIIVEEAERLIIFVDELDRCRPTYAVEMLERIKHFFDDERVVFVFSVNREQLAHTISNFYGSNFDSEKYLNRFFDYCFALPALDIETSLQALGYMRSGTYLSCISAELQSYYGLKLRDAILFTAKMESISDRVQKECGSGKDVIMIFLMVPVISVLDFVSVEQKNQILNGKGWDILENIISNCPKHYAECVGQLVPKFQKRKNEDSINAIDIFKNYYELSFKQSDDYQDRELPFELRGLKSRCIKFCNEVG